MWVLVSLFTVWHKLCDVMWAYYVWNLECSWHHLLELFVFLEFYLVMATNRVQGEFSYSWICLASLPRYPNPTLLQNAFFFFNPILTQSGPAGTMSPISNINHSNINNKIKGNLKPKSPYPLIHKNQIHLKSKFKPKYMQLTTSDLKNQI